MRTSASLGTLKHTLGLDWPHRSIDNFITLTGDCQALVSGLQQSTSAQDICAAGPLHSRSIAIQQSSGSGKSRLVQAVDIYPRILPLVICFKPAGLRRIGLSSW